MKRQKSFDNNSSTLYIVPTPIGNLDEMTPRAIEILKEVDIIACEDTRNTGKLLEHFNIKTKLIQHHNFNEDNSTKGILKLLEDGNNVAIVSDAGYPLINDPGQLVVSEAINHNYNVVPLSGCNAMLNGLVASGLIAQPFIFIGFLSPNKNECIKQLKEYEDYPMTLVFYEAPHRIEKTLSYCLDVFGNRKMCLARELTKRYEEFLRGSISEVLEVADALKGEMVIIIEGKKKEKDVINIDDISLLVNEQISNGMSKSDAIKFIAKQTGISKNEIYNQLHDKKEA